MNSPSRLSGEEVLRYLPQRPPIILVDEMLERGPDHIITGITVRPDDLFVEDDHMREGGLIEHVAQSAALGIGLSKAAEADGAPPIGFIGSVSRLRIARTPRIGERLRTEVRTQHRIGPVEVVQGLVRSNGEEIATMEMKVFLMDDGGGA
ncbi:MAG: hypothetical protein H6595_09025 [Flavobacteriales bacterium]|nr:hypothetical protein [Flavobacteriales bacterium]MCB9167609.1 hypothetical protein [Flavobacteriales bacterium]